MPWSLLATYFQAALQERPQPLHLQTRRLCGWLFRPFSSSFRALVDVFRTGNWVWALGDPWWLMLPTIPHVVILCSSAARMAAKHLPTAQAVGLSFAAAVSVCARGHGRCGTRCRASLAPVLGTSRDQPQICVHGNEFVCPHAM